MKLVSLIKRHLRLDLVRVNRSISKHQTVIWIESFHLVRVETEIIFKKMNQTNPINLVRPIFQVLCLIAHPSLCYYFKSNFAYRFFCNSDRKRSYIIVSLIIKRLNYAHTTANRKLGGCTLPNLLLC